ncbi:MAG TPA: hypothetical protein DHV62_08870 [Elusimicrobia bacterium]|jgi:putative inorganic carbon (HCO3(-)) transporter|nr:hypothetical protein [Elusimicrobiota bacterium]
MLSSRNSERLLHWGLPLFYFLVSVAFYLRTYDSCQIKITLLQIGAVVLLTLWFFKLLNESISPFSDKMTLVLPLILFLLSGIVSFLFSRLKEASFPELVRRISYVGLALIVLTEFNSEEKIRHLFTFLVAACAVSTIYGLIQFLDWHFFPSLPEPGLDPFIWRGAFGPRIFSTFGNPNFFGDFLVTISPLLLGLVLKSRNKFLIFLFLLVTFDLIFTYSKAAWIGYTAGIVSFSIISVIYFSHFQKGNLRRIVIIFLIGLIILCSAGVVYFVKQRIDSVRFRVFTWLSTWEMILKRPIQGTGIGTFYVVYPLYRRPQIFHIEGKHNTESDHPENEHLEIWYDEGTIGFGIFYWLILTYLVFGFRALRRYVQMAEIRASPSIKKKRVFIYPSYAYYLLGSLSALIGLLVHNLMCVSLRFVSSGIYLGLLIGLIGRLSLQETTTKPLSVKSNPREISASPSSLISLKTVLQLVILLCAIYLVKLFYGFFEADIHHNIAIFFSKQGQWDHALSEYNEVAKRNPFFPMAHYFMGNVFNDRFNIEKTHRPEWGDRKISATLIAQFQQKYTKDIEMGNREFRLNPALNEYEEYRNDPQRAIDKYDGLRRIAPNYVQMHHQVGLVYLKLGDWARNQGNVEKAKIYWQKALENFEKYRAIDPVFSPNYYRMAWIYVQLGNLAKAEEMYRTDMEAKECNKPYHNILRENWYLTHRHENQESYVNLGNLLYHQGKIEEAEKNYKKAIEIYPNSVEAWRNLAIIYQQQNRLAEASLAWKKVSEIHPHDKEAQRLFEITHQRLRQ